MQSHDDREIGALIVKQYFCYPENSKFLALMVFVTDRQAINKLIFNHFRDLSENALTSLTKDTFTGLVPPALQKL